MSCERDLDDIVTEFLLNTCRLCPPPSKCAIRAAALCADQAGMQPNRDADSGYLPLTTGSVAEFYIEPMLSCIGDIDLMVYWNAALAIPRGHPPPTQLPAEFHNYVRVLEIIDSHLPGYVHLELRYLLTECSDDGNYNSVEYDRGHYLGNHYENGRYDAHGPALCFPMGDTGMTFDQVYCIRCLLWPPQAADWPTRHRNYSWPDSATLDRVVNNGCDVVAVAHRHCRQHKWLGRYQHRLSFSRAEIVLINSWVPVQQIVYHMLRYFIETERLTDCANNSGAGTLSNYHIKTLMLWACELKSRSWWTENLNLVRICVQLLHIFAEWLTEARCQHYLVNNCNLIDKSFNVTNIGERLMSIDKAWLSTWFVDNYIRKCSQLTPHYISLLFDDISTSIKLQTAVSAVVAWRLNNYQLNLWKRFCEIETAITEFVCCFPLTVRSCFCWMTQLHKTESHHIVFFTAVVFLHVAYRSLRHGLSDDLMDILATVLRRQFTSTQRRPNNFTSVLKLNIVAKLMKAVANKSLSTMSLIEIELSKAYLYRALRCKDSESDYIYCLANVYLAVLYYTTGQYQTAIDHCTLVTRSQDHSQCSSHVVQGEILPKINDDVDIVLGLAVFYQHVRTAALNQKNDVQHVIVFTTELFAYYLHIKCMLVTKCHHLMQSTSEFRRYGICVGGTQQLFVGDVLLFLSVTRLLRYPHKPQHSPTNANKRNTSYLVDLLQKSAVEHLTAYRQDEVQDFGAVGLVTIVTTDFEAMYAYKRGDYQRCLQLSTQNVHMLLFAVEMHSVPALSEFIQLLDDDIVSLTALTLIVDPECRKCSRYVSISPLTLSLYLLIQCQLKLHHPLTSLAQTLECIKVAERRHTTDSTINLLVLKFSERKALLSLREMQSFSCLIVATLLQLCC